MTMVVGGGRGVAEFVSKMVAGEDITDNYCCSVFGNLPNGKTITGHSICTLLNGGCKRNLKSILCYFPS